MSELVSHHSVMPRNNVVQNMFEIMDKAYRFSEIIAASDIIPLHYRGKVANVFIAVQTAHRLGLDPMLVMQNTYVLNGKLGMNSIAIALANSSGLLTGSIRYEVVGEGEAMVVTAHALLKSSRQEMAFPVSMKEARAEGWTKNAKYQSLPRLMLSYRAAVLLIRTHIPEVLNGMQMVEELEDVFAAREMQRVVSGKDEIEPTVASKLDQFLAQEEGEVVEGSAIAAVEVGEQSELPQTLVGELHTLIETHQIPPEVIDKWCKKGGVDDLKKLDEDQIQSCINFIAAKLDSAKARDKLLASKI